MRTSRRISGARASTLAVMTVGALLIGACSDDASDTAHTADATSTSAAPTSTSASTTSTTSTTVASTRSTTEPPTTTAAPLDGPYRAPDGSFSVEFPSPPVVQVVDEALGIILYMGREPNNDRFNIGVRPPPSPNPDLAALARDQTSFMGPGVPHVSDVTVQGHRALLWAVDDQSEYAAHGLIIDTGDRLFFVSMLDDGADNDAEALAFIASFVLTG